MHLYQFHQHHLHHHHHNRPRHRRHHHHRHHLHNQSNYLSTSMSVTTPGLLSVEFQIKRRRRRLQLLTSTTTTTTTTTASENSVQGNLLRNRYCSFYSLTVGPSLIPHHLTSTLHSFVIISLLSSDLSSFHHSFLPSFSILLWRFQVADALFSVSRFFVEDF